MGNDRERKGQHVCDLHVQDPAETQATHLYRTQEVSVTTEKANALVPTEDENGSHQSKSVRCLAVFFFKLSTQLWGEGYCSILCVPILPF